MLTLQGSVFSEILQLGVDLAPDLRDQDAGVKGGQLRNIINSTVRMYATLFVVSFLFLGDILGSCGKWLCR